METYTDTDLRARNRSRHGLTVFFGVLFVIACTIAIITAILGVLLLDTQNMLLTYAGEESEHIREWTGALWIVGIVSGLITLLSLFVSVRYTGRLLPEGGVALNWFDKIFTEIQVVAGIMAGCIIVPAFYILDSWFWHEPHLLAAVSSFKPIYHSDWWDGPIPADMGEFLKEYRGYEISVGPEWVKPMLTVLFVLAGVAFCLLVVHSIARKLKARRFWRSTIIGAIVYAIFKKAEKSDHTELKVMLFLLGGALLSATVFGAIPVIILILIFIPRLLRQFLELKKGVAELAKGNTDYKIPVTSDGEIDRLCEKVNSIADAQKIAVANELKNQRMRTELISNVSHDLRTPLTSMVSYVDLLKSEGLTSERAPEYLTILSEKTERLKKLTDDLFEAAKASSGDIPVEITRLEMNSIANQAAAELHENLEKNGINLILTSKADETYVMADGRLLWRVIENLLTNVAKYALPNTRAYMDISERDGRIALEVKNMSRDQLNIDVDELMERFKRGDSARNTDGSGLGLAIARDLTELMGGTFDLHIDGDLFKATVLLKKAEAPASETEYTTE